MPRFRNGFDRRVQDLRRSQIRRILRRPWTTVPAARRSVDLLRACLKRNDEEGRRRLFGSPAVGGWIQDVILWISARDLADTILTKRSTPEIRDALFERIARTEYLVELVPSGRLDPGFASRVRKRALRSLWERMTDLPRILLPHFPPSPEPLEIPLFFREVPEEGCPPDRIRLGESPLWIVWKGGTPPMALKTHLVNGSLVISAPVNVEPHETIPGTGILVTHRLVSHPRCLKVGPPVSGLAPRLARALALAEKAWPRGGKEIRERTWMVVPLSERGTVSYSQMARPGISYINVFRGSLLNLTDDLLHETAHHRLHALQEVEPLLRDGGDSVYYSPWRRTFRPLNGILHGAFAFLYRSELFRRILRLPPQSRDAAGITLNRRVRRWLEEEATRESAHCRASLADLDRAESEGLLTDAGSDLLARVHRRHRALAAGRLSLETLSGIL